MPSSIILKPVMRIYIYFHFHFYKKLRGIWSYLEDCLNGSKWSWVNLTQYCNCHVVKSGVDVVDNFHSLLVQIYGNYISEILLSCLLKFSPLFCSLKSWLACSVCWNLPWFAACWNIDMSSQLKSALVCLLKFSCFFSLKCWLVLFAEIRLGLQLVEELPPINACMSRPDVQMHQKFSAFHSTQTKKLKRQKRERNIHLPFLMSRPDLQMHSSTFSPSKVLRFSFCSIKKT